MNKKILMLLCFAALLSSAIFSHAQDNNEIASVKFSLSEFRDVSIWKGRRGLSLFSPDGKYLAVSGKSADVVIYETATGSVKTKIDGSGFKAFSFSPDGAFVVAQNASDASIDIFETESGRQVRKIRGRSKLGNIKRSLYATAMNIEMDPIQISSDWKNVLVSVNDKEFELIDFASGEMRYEFEHENFNTTWEVTKLLVIGASALSGNPAAGMLLMMTGNATSQTQFSSDGKYVVISNGNKTPTLWSVETGRLISRFETKHGVYRVLFSPNGKMISTSDSRGVTNIWDVESGNLISTFGSKKDRTLVSMWSSDSERVLTVGFPKKNDIRTFEAKTGKNLFNFEKSSSFSFVPSPDAKFIATVQGKSKSVLFQIWETETGKLLVTVPRSKGEDALISLVWSPESELLVTSNGLREDIAIWNLDGERVQTLTNSIFPMKFSSDGKYLATGGRTWDPKNDVGFIWEFKNSRYKSATYN